MQLAVPKLRTASGLRVFNAALKRHNHNLFSWRESEHLPAREVINGSWLGRSWIYDLLQSRWIRTLGSLAIVQAAIWFWGGFLPSLYVVPSAFMLGLF